MFLPQRVKLISLVLPLVFSVGAQALPKNYGTAQCVEKNPDQPTKWTLKAVPNIKQSTGQPMSWLLTLNDADGKLKFSKVRFRVEYMAANARRREPNGYPVVDFNGKPGTKYVTFNTPAQSGYEGYFAYISIMDFVDDKGAIVKSVAVDKAKTLNSGGIKGVDFRMENDNSQIKFATGINIDIANNSYLFNNSHTRLSINSDMTCDEHKFTESYWRTPTEFNHEGVRFSGQYGYIVTNQGVNANWSCNYTVTINGLKVANGQSLTFERRGFHPIAARKPTIFHQWQNHAQAAYFNLRPNSTGDKGSVTIN